MSGILPAGSPFDAIRQVGSGGEFWSARDLMPLLGYVQWRRFEDAIERARTSAEIQGHDVTSHFAGAGKTPVGGGPVAQDFMLTRFAAYLVAMNGDPRKPEVAAAQALKPNVLASQRGMAAVEYERVCAVRAKKRQEEAAIRGNQSRANGEHPVREELPQPAATDEAGGMFSVSGKTVRDANRHDRRLCQVTDMIKGVRDDSELRR